MAAINEIRVKFDNEDQLLLRVERQASFAGHVPFDLVEVVYGDFMGDDPHEGIAHFATGVERYELKDLSLAVLAFQKRLHSHHPERPSDLCPEQTALFNKYRKEPIHV